MLLCEFSASVLQKILSWNTFRIWQKIKGIVSFDSHIEQLIDRSKCAGHARMKNLLKLRRFFDHQRRSD